jgi:hypothetical protein
MDDQAARTALAGAFRRNAIRGTAAHLREVARLIAGVEVRIEDPGQAISLWSLGEHSTLGIETVLTTIHPDGAVVGGAATAGQSVVLDDPNGEAPIVAEVLEPVLLQAYAADLPDAAAAERLRQALEAEAPATTPCRFELIGPLMRVGLQARLGVDAIVAGPPVPLALGSTQPLGMIGALARPGGELPAGQIGADASVGRSVIIGYTTGE